MAIWLMLAGALWAAPRASMVMDARTGKVLHSDNANTPLHPASLTKMMTLYIAFEAVQHGEISMDTVVTVSRNASAEPASKLWLRPGQKIKLRYLVRAAAVKSANDAATAIGEAISGSEAAFIERMNRTAKGMGMTHTRFRNANGLTASGHKSSARDMAILGRHMIYDYPMYYNLFGRISTPVERSTVYNTNRKFLRAYSGADGIKTGYTNAAGFNLVGSAERGGVRIVAAVFGESSVAARNAKMGRLLDLGFKNAPSRVAMRMPALPPYLGKVGSEQKLASASPTYGHAAHVVRTVNASTKLAVRPLKRPGSGVVEPAVPLDSLPLPGAKPELGPEIPVADPAMIAALSEGIDAALNDLALADAAAVQDDVPLGQGDTGGLPEVSALSPEAQALVSALARSRPLARPGSETGDALSGEETAMLQSPQMQEVVKAAAREAEGLGLTPRARITESAISQSRAAQPRDRGEVVAPAVAFAAPIPARNLPEPAPVARAQLETAPAPAMPTELATRLPTQGSGHWGINLGAFATRVAAETLLVQVALTEADTLRGAAREVSFGRAGHGAAFTGMTQDSAELACRRLQARLMNCTVVGPNG